MRINEPESSGPRPGVLILTVVLSIVLMTVWFREGANGPIHRIRVGLSSVTAPVSAAGEFVTAPVRGLFAWAGDLGVSRSELQRLRDQNGRLRSRVAQLEEARKENVRLRRLVGLSEAAELPAVAARVIGRPTSWEDVITIDRGSAEGIRNGMPVLVAEGLLGQTIQTSRNSSRVRLLTDQRSGVAAMIQRTRAEGIARGTVEGDLTLDFVSQETTVRAGDIVITSGMGGVYPKGLTIGEVLKVQRDAGGLHQSIVVAPTANIRFAEEVLVVTAPSDTNEPPTGGE